MKPIIAISPTLTTRSGSSSIANFAQTEKKAPKYQGKLVESNFYHYEFLGEHFETVRVYYA